MNESVCMRHHSWVMALEAGLLTNHGPCAMRVVACTHVVCRATTRACPHQASSPTVSVAWAATVTENGSTARREWPMPVTCPPRSAPPRVSTTFRVPSMATMAHGAVTCCSPSCLHLGHHVRRVTQLLEYGPLAKLLFVPRPAEHVVHRRQTAHKEEGPGGGLG